MSKKDLIKISFNFAKKSVKLTKLLDEKYNQNPIVTKFLKSATNIGAIIYREKHCLEKKDYLIALKNSLYLASETKNSLIEMYNHQIISEKEYKKFYEEILKFKKAVNKELGKDDNFIIVKFLGNKIKALKIVGILKTVKD